MGLFSRKKKTELVPKINVTQAEINQRRLNMQAELDQIDFEAMKAERNARRNKLKAQERKEKLNGVLSTIDTSLGFISDVPLRDPVGKKSKSSLDDPFGGNIGI